MTAQIDRHDSMAAAERAYLRSPVGLIAAPAVD
jgi:hypothetical protein